MEKLENSLSDTDANQTFRSPPRRRRSTFFERRDSVVPTQLKTPESVDLADYTKDVESKMRAEEMKSYYEKLLSEKEQWKKEVKERRNKYHDLRQQYQMAATGPSRSRMSYAALSNEDIEFLKAKPNISKLVDCQQRFHTSLKETMAYVGRKNELDRHLLDYCEDKVDRIRDHILQTSTID